ncbi:MAG: hypothetical protein KAY37_07435 [Phycisphaerae bacterium]|nr:hypothetical protein [Phycisphaerae bacterium]
MIELPTPPPLFNPITGHPPLDPVEIFAGPFGLLAFLPLVPVILLVARRYRRTALIASGLVWMLATLHVRCTVVVLAGLAAATAWILLLGTLRRRGRLSARGMIALVWVGLNVLVWPLWWQAQHPAWCPSRMQVLHSVGLAYLLLRFIAWGVEMAKNPRLPVRLTETICWLLYAPCMRLGPVLLREEFLRRFDAWDPRRSPAWKEGAKRFGLFLLGGVGVGFVGAQIPAVGSAAVDFFTAPENYTTGELFRVFYLVPIQVYLLLWTYNELAAALALWVGLRVDNNFNWLPRATSVRDFWRRWHITLGTWLRNYIYIPLGGNRRHVPLNYAAVFGYCGVWHGAGWSFPAWGLSQAFALTVQRGWDRLVARLGWQRLATRRWWIALCWVLTMHYQIATLVVFVDFDHLGLRLFGELLRRVSGG